MQGRWVSRQSVVEFAEDASPLMQQEYTRVPSPSKRVVMRHFATEMPAPGEGGEDTEGSPRTCWDWLQEEVSATSAIVALFYTVFVYNHVYVGRILPALGKDHFALPFAITFDAMWGMMFWSWLQAHLEDPGTVPTRWREFCTNAGDALSVAPSKREWQPGKATFCKKCSILRPERSHHCKVCNSCVLRLDHHCPFIKNCVGFHNHKFFLLLLVYGACTSIVGLGTALPELVRLTAALIRLQAGIPWQFDEISVLDAIFLLGFAGIAATFAAIFPPMVLLHVPLAAHNQTKIENAYDNMPNPYDLGTSQANLSQLLGAPGWDWIVPIRPMQPLSDGVAFPRGDLGTTTSQLNWFASGEPVEKLWRIRYQVPIQYHARTMDPETANTCGGCLA